MIKLASALFLLAAAVDTSAVIESAYCATRLRVEPRSQKPRVAQGAARHRVADYLGQPIAGPPTEIRSRWTKDNLYLFYICPYDDLNLKPDPNPAVETPELWNWDVAEAFIGSDYEHITRYKEFQVSPQSEWVDLDIDRGNQKGQVGMAWNSGYTVKGRVDDRAKIWYGAMKIPWKAIDTRPPQKGRELRIGLYRIAGHDPEKVLRLARHGLEVVPCAESVRHAGVEVRRRNTTLDLRTRHPQSVRDRRARRQVEKKISDRKGRPKPRDIPALPGAIETQHSARAGRRE